MKALSTRNDAPTKASRPFDKDRDGFVMGEGGGAFVLEEYEFAKKRGARIYAELVGYAATADAYHMTSPAPEGEGAARSMAMALRHARLNPDQINYINAHGTSTQANDASERDPLQPNRSDVPIRNIALANKWRPDMNATLAKFFARDGVAVAGVSTEVMGPDKFQRMGVEADHFSSSTGTMRGLEFA